MNRVKKTQLRWSIPVLLVAVLLLALAPAALAGVKADTALINGKIITVDAKDSVVQAMAIKDGKVIALGKTTQIRPYINSKTKVIDLHGRTATPGMIDSHNHFSGTSALFVVDLGPLNCTNVADIQAAVKAQCDIVGAGNWAQGRNWGQAYLDEQRPLYASDLDPVSPNNPVFLRETSGHQAVANSVALKIAGITASTPDPEGGIIDRDANGNPTGLLKESATGLVSKYIPPFSEDQQKEGLRYIIKYANSIGLTSILVPSGSATSWNRYKAIEDEGNLSVRLGMLWSSGRTVAATNTLIDQVKVDHAPR